LKICSGESPETKDQDKSNNHPFDGVPTIHFNQHSPDDSQIRENCTCPSITSLFKSRKTIVVGNITLYQQHGYSSTTKAIDLGYIAGDNFS
jgi:hypothetical protein